ncbi:hypothetical protein [Empedobacter sedimenti]|uniref:hypothetical protein n=1 Tax=Empedobacter sedimenti TaxID=3042610 RepID=UPI0024A78872|nr:hypothetical protein [Empedobacter sedimenti]
MNRILLYNLSLLFCISLQAQSTLISGKIIVDDADEIINLDGFSIENSTTNAKTFANAKGLFSIKVNEGDELLFNQLGIVQRRIKVSQSMINKGFIEVHVNIEVIELAETKIKPLKKFWKDNISKEETESEKFNKSIGINKEFKLDVVKAFYAANYLKGLGGAYRYENVLALMDMFTKDAKSHKDLRAFVPKKKYENIEFLISYFTDYYFTNDLKIPKGNIFEFLNYCYVETKIEELLKANQFDQIVLILEEQAPIYLSKINSKSMTND